MRKPQKNAEAIPPVVPHSVREVRRLSVAQAMTSGAVDALYPVDQFDATQEESASWSMLWGDVSIAARHPARILA